MDFLSKKREANEGEVPQYYVEGSHDAIIEPAEWQLVQMEIQRRKNLGRRFKESSGQASGSFRIFWPFFLCVE